MHSITQQQHHQQQQQQLYLCHLVNHLSILHDIQSLRQRCISLVGSVVHWVNLVMVGIFSDLIVMRKLCWPCDLPSIRQS